MVQKSRDAFRTISEVADWLDVPTHVLRFWESRFSQIKPVKRAGGRRYYRPSDMRVIGGVKTLLHDQGMTIRGVQKLFREEGIKHVSSFSAPLHGETGQEITPQDAIDAVDASAEPAIAAPAARSSRDAVRDPIIDPAGPATAEENDREATPIFSHQSAQTPQPAAEPPASEIEPPAARAEPPPEAETPQAQPEPVVEDKALQPSGEPEIEDNPASAPSETLDLVDAMSAPEVGGDTSDDEAAPSRSIPDTPDVPATDPDDLAADFAEGPGLAARLRLADPATI